MVLVKILCFRIITHKLVGIGCGGKAITYNKCVGEKFGKCHRSKDTLWVEIQPFVVFIPGYKLKKESNTALKQEGKFSR